jgi:hypothetical protein
VHFYTNGFEVHSANHDRSPLQLVPSEIRI